MLRKIYRRIKRRIRAPYSYQVFRNRCYILGVTSLTEKTRILVQTLIQLFIKRRRVLFYPDDPRTLFVIYKLFLFLGYRITADPSKKCDIVVKWRNSMDGNPYLPPEPVLEKLAHNNPEIKFINMKCNDVTKMQVNKIFEHTFGYSLSVDPTKHSGKSVMKSDWNGLHVGEVIECPTTTKKDGFVYQKLINNEVKDGLVEDVRVPIFKDRIPFVYLKYRPLATRLVDRSHSNQKAIIAEVADKLTEEEVNKVIKFSNNMGMEYGEVDVLRDKNEGKIYIVDVNNNPAGPPEPISENDSKTAIIRLAKAFEEALLS